VEERVRAAGDDIKETSGNKTRLKEKSFRPDSAARLSLDSALHRGIHRDRVIAADLYLTAVRVWKTRRQNFNSASNGTLSLNVRRSGLFRDISLKTSS
jgi:hypothetical protein